MLEFSFIIMVLVYTKVHRNLHSRQHQRAHGKYINVTNFLTPESIWDFNLVYRQGQTDRVKIKAVLFLSL